jgi:hypothetical protein
MVMDLISRRHGNTAASFFTPHPPTPTFAHDQRLQILLKQLPQTFIRIEIQVRIYHPPIFTNQHIVRNTRNGLPRSPA